MGFNGDLMEFNGFNDVGPYGVLMGFNGDEKWH